MDSNKEISKEVRQFLDTFKNMIEEIIDAHDKLTSFISTKAPDGSIKDKDALEYKELSDRFWNLTKQFSSTIKEFIERPTTK